MRRGAAGDLEDPIAASLELWSVGVQFAVATILAAFFATLFHALRLPEIRLWAAAWAADAAAIAAVFGGVWLLPHEPVFLRLTAVAYAAGKTAFVFLLVAGARTHLRPGTEFRFDVRPIAVIVVIWSLSLGLFAGGMGLVQLGQSLMVGGMLTVGAVWVLRNPRFARSKWLGWAFLLEGLLFLHYVPILLPLVWHGRPLVLYQPFSSFLDAGAELLVALASLVALESSTSERLHHLNRELEASRDRLRQLVDLDPLTNLANRRALRGTLATLSNQGATLIFIDLDDFKSVNDIHGHLIGDRCLQRLGAVLAHTFRAEDALFRWGGDEFLVVAPGLSPDAAAERMRSVRTEVESGTDEIPQCTLSFGVANLAPAGDAEAALAAADRAMYEEKARRRAGRRSSGGRISGLWPRI